MRRRHLLLAAGALPLAGPVQAQVNAPQFAAVTPRPLAFPRDHGAHPDYRTEWWYLTGWLDEDSAAPFGFQITFFRARTELDPANPSRFAAQQLVIAHAAIADPARGGLIKDERVARAGFGVAQADERDTDVLLERWRLRRRADGIYECDVPARGFALRFTAQPTQPLLLQGDQGYSRKGPRPEHASCYYSQPQLAVQATLTRDGRSTQHRGHAWLDHEWSSTVLDPAASGWDWVGMNLADGSALTAFSIRRKEGSTPLWAYAALRAAGARAPRIHAPGEVRFTPLERWTSPRTRAAWPIAQRIEIGSRAFETRPLMADQELDSRTSTGAVYWEGASTLLEDGRKVGAGYLEMTGYVSPIRL